MVRDGRSAFRCSWAQWIWGQAPPPRRGFVPRLAARHRLVLPDVAVVADVPPLQARVERGALIVDCPCLAAEMVWLEGPHVMWCPWCGNAEVGGLPRPVALPEGVA